MLSPEGAKRPSFAIRFATKLPNASNESGLGLDTTDFYISALGAKTIESMRVVGNLGLGILGDPTRGDRQNDVLTYGLSLARAMTSAAEVVGEVNGHVDTRAGEPLPGTESRSLGRIGARYTIGGWRADGGDALRLHIARSRRRRRGGIHVCVRRLSSSVKRNCWPVDFYRRSEPDPAPMQVVKAHAYGNDFLLAPQEDQPDPGGLARRACDRHRGIGADGLILYRLADRGATMALFNADGSPSELSGNGLRCLATLVARARKLSPGAVVTVDTAAGVKTLELISTERSRYTFRTALGPPTDVRQLEIPVLGETIIASVLRMGNPQCVVLGPLPDVERYHRLGLALSTHSMFRCRHQRRVCEHRGARSGSHPHLGTRRRSNDIFGNGDGGIRGSCGGARRSESRCGSHRDWREPARRMAGRRRLSDRVGRAPPRGPLAARVDPDRSSASQRTVWRPVHPPTQARSFHVPLLRAPSLRLRWHRLVK